VTCVSPSVGGTDDAPGLARPDHEVVVLVVVAAGDAMAVHGRGRGADGPLPFAFLVGVRPLPVHLDDAAHAFDHPLDAPAAAGRVFLVVNRGR